MEAAGLAVGIAGLVAICLDVVERVETYKSFGTDSRQLNARFEACKLRLREWAGNVGIVDGNLILDHHTRLDEPEVATVVKRILFSVCEIFGKAEEIQKKLNLVAEPEDVQSSSWQNTPEKNDKSFTMTIRRTKQYNIGWTIKGKTQFTDQVNMLEALIGGLYDIVSPMEGGGLGKHGHLAQEALREINITQRSLKPFLEEIKHNNRQQAYQQVNEWLDIRSPDRQYEQYLETRLEGTCDWILDNSCYLDWISTCNRTESKLLWINGPSGCGKSVVCASIYGILMDDHVLSCAYVSGASHVQAGGQPDSIVRYWLSQITRVNETAFSIVLESMRSRYIAKTASNNQAWTLLKDIVTKINDCVFIIDGIDRYTRSRGQRTDFLQKLRTTIAGTNTRCLVVSRRESDIELELNTAIVKQDQCIIYDCKITQEIVNADIQLYSNHVVDTQLPREDESFRRQLAADMASRSQGIFSLIKMQQDRLREGKTQKELHNIIQNMSRGTNRINDRDPIDTNKHPQTVSSEKESENNALHFACAVGDMSVAQAILEAGVNVDALGSKSRTPLMAAALSGHLEIARSLLDLGADANATDENGWTPLHWATQQGPVAFTKLLLEHGADINAVDKGGWTSLHWAADYGHLEFVQLLMDHGADLHATDQRGWTSLHWAAKNGHLEISSLLLDHGALVNGTDSDDWTPLHKAARYGHPEIIQLLIQHGADISATEEHGWTALHNASDDGHAEVAEWLLECGADINAVDRDGMTTLHWAAYYGHLRFTRLLLEHGALVNAKTDKMWTPLMLAVSRDHTEVVAAILDFGGTME